MPEDRSRERKRFLTGLIGAPIAQSASPAMHERAADALGVRCHYQLIEVAGADAAGLRALLEGVKNFGFAGVNVTFPYKEAVVPLLDDWSDGARAIGAVNTVVVRQGKLIGYNTDTSNSLSSISIRPRRRDWRRSCWTACRCEQRQASRMPCRARSASSMERRSACCRTATRRFPPR
jgi:shikimate 5-dehydrogenase